ncbi:aminotransferase class I/II-fold pyridoxal phosphate-dependent enzyme [Chitinispirillales bacterium ANBcel5]|uniref:aminotransferase class I/II-fold pyridoxal phosphate-dependent enzyme n=1 Tax=Cellulosispirillum alkaliphilum TaxID=3039283 RepID=UPI002A5051F3|nr:aminotransferase class I/II-fold pyridoxal phosphate-dependent enzyme [Chitinispirillales bacterium ANBcel5]
MSKRIYLSPPHMSGKELEFINEAFSSNWIAPVGPHIDLFEKEMCDYTGANYAVALSSGTAALHLALLLSGVKKGDEVFCSTFTFAGSAFPISYLGAQPIFIDSETESWNMDPKLLKTAIEERIKKGKKPGAVIVVHLYGQSASMKEIKSVCEHYKVSLIEDAAESLGSYYEDNHTATIGDFGLFSFNGNKIITTSGGGMLIGASKEKIEKARYLSTQAREPKPYYEHWEVGYNYRMSNICAAIGRGQLSVIEKRVSRKREIFKKYKETLAAIKGISFMPDPQWGRSNKWLSCISIDPQLARFSCETLRLALENENIESRPLWKPMHLQPVFKHAGCFISGVSESLFNSGLCLPSGTAINDEDLTRVIETIKEVSRSHNSSSLHN